MAEDFTNEEFCDVVFQSFFKVSLVKSFRGLVMEEYLVLAQIYFLFLCKTYFCGYSLETAHCQSSLKEYVSFRQFPKLSYRLYHKMTFYTF